MSVPVTDTTAEDIFAAIRHGDVDDHLEDIFEAVKRRVDAAAKAKFAKLKVGDEITFTDSAGNLAGTTGVIVKKNRTRVEVRADHDGRVYVGSPHFLEIA